MKLQILPTKFFEIFVLWINISSVLSCQPPDSAEGGSYHPEQTIYLPGDKVAYNCTDGLTRTGKDTRVCQTTGKWSGTTPFCDSPTRVKNPSAASDPKGQVANLVDGRTDTCFQTRNATGQSVTLYLGTPAPVHMLRIYMREGKVRLNIHICQRKGRTAGPLCIVSDVRNIEKDQWMTLECEDSDVQADYVVVQDPSDKAAVLTMCEIEVFVKDDAWCKQAPNIFIPHGRLEVSRNKASLRCAKGYKEGPNTRLVCEKNKWVVPIMQCEEIICDGLVGNGSLAGGEWSRLGNTGKFSVGTQLRLHCDSEFRMTGQPDVVTCLDHGGWSATTATCVANKPKKGPNYKIIGVAVSTVIVVIIFFLLGLTLFLVQKKRSREVVVIYKPTEDPYSPISLNSAGTTACSEAPEYSTVYYEAIRNHGPPPMPARPSPYLKKGYAGPVDALSPQEGAFSASNTLPADIAFGSLKSSSLYDTLQ